MNFERFFRVSSDVAELGCVENFSHAQGRATVKTLRSQNVRRIASPAGANSKTEEREPAARCKKTPDDV